jgi:hypothetical protein
VVTRLLHIVEDTPMIIHGKNKKKFNDSFLWATSSRMSLKGSLKVIWKGQGQSEHVL